MGKTKTDIMACSLPKRYQGSLIMLETTPYKHIKGWRIKEHVFMCYLLWLPVAWRLEPFITLEMENSNQLFICTYMYMHSVLSRKTWSHLYCSFLLILMSMGSYITGYYNTVFVFLKILSNSKLFSLNFNIFSCLQGFHFNHILSVLSCGDSTLMSWNCLTQSV